MMHDSAFRRSAVRAAGLFILLAAGTLSSCSRFGGEPEPYRIRLSWRTETEDNAFGFYVWRADSEQGELAVVNAENPVPAAGTTNIPRRYVYYDLDVEPGRAYYYKLQQVDLDGTKRWIVPVEGTKPVKGTPKPLTEEEKREIEERGTAWGEAAVGE